MSTDNEKNTYKEKTQTKGVTKMKEKKTKDADYE